MNPRTDPVTFAVIKHGLDAIVDEMAYTVLRTARSEIVKDVTKTKEFETIKKSKRRTHRENK